MYAYHAPLAAAGDPNARPAKSPDKPSTVLDFSSPFIGKGTSLLGRFNVSSVTPSVSFVMPTTGGSPFLTNSYNP